MEAPEIWFPPALPVSIPTGAGAASKPTGEGAASIPTGESEIWAFTEVAEMNKAIAKKKKTDWTATLLVNAISVEGFKF